MFKTLRQILGIILIVDSVGFGIYVGLWLFLVGGIVQVVNSITPVVNNAGIAMGSFKGSFR